jgi:hypothetical protein
VASRAGPCDPERDSMPGTGGASGVPTSAIATATRPGDQNAFTMAVSIWKSNGLSPVSGISQ